MEVKGSAILTIPDFIKKEFGEDAYKKWLESLSIEAKKVYSNPILPSTWYNLKTSFAEPIDKICELFYSGDTKGAWISGRFSADYALKGIYKIFVKFGSIEFLLHKSSTIMQTYYNPSKIETTMEGKSCKLRFSDFPEMTPVIEGRISGWIERAMEISGAKDINFKNVKSITKNDPYSEIHISWN